VTPAGEVLRQLRGLPRADIDTIAPGTSLILAPHPDDETLGCGGLIIECCLRGRAPLIVAVTDGAGSHPGSTSYPPVRLKEVRAAELHAAAVILGVPQQHVRFLDLPDTRAPTRGRRFDLAVHTIATLIRDHAVSNLLATWRYDPHSDHQATACIASAVARITRVRLLFYLVWGWLLPAKQLLPVRRVRGTRLHVAAVRKQKRLALAAHASQCSGLISDDPDGFRLPAGLLAVADADYEVFLQE
jgi:LmbE family N-acetylglucosaminyl deacetylase